MAWGTLRNIVLGPRMSLYAVSQAGNTVNPFDMAAVNKCWAVRFTAGDTRDVKSLWVNWATVTNTPNSSLVEFRIETIDATTGKPTGTLYDANATKVVTPAAGWQNIVFDVLPTTGLTVGNEYALVAITTQLGTALTMRGNWAMSLFSALPVSTLTATDGSTRSNLAEITGSIPVCTFVMEDDVEELFDCVPFDSTQTTGTIYGTRAWGVKFTIPCTLNVFGVEVPYFLRTGTPTGNLHGRIFTGGAGTGGSIVSGADRIVDKDSLVNSHTRGCRFRFGTPVSLTAGTYRFVMNQTDTASTSGNNWAMRQPVARGSSVVPSGWIGTMTTDIVAGGSEAAPGTITWTDAAAEFVPIYLLLDEGSQAGGGSGMIVHPGLVGGARG